MSRNPRPPEAIAAQPLDMQVLDCVVREWVEHGEPSICYHLVRQVPYHHWTRMDRRLKKPEPGPHTIFSRLRELKKAGYIVKVGARKPTDRSKRKQAEWKPTPQGRKVHSAWRAERKAEDEKRWAAA